VFQVSPEEIEKVIADLEGVLDVVIAGVQDDENELPIALVVKGSDSNLSEDDIIQVVSGLFHKLIINF